MDSHRRLGLWTLTALVAGNMIGSGVFLLPASLAAYGSIGLVAWVFTSLGTIVLALVFARLSRMMPKAGGPYAYCRAAYGKFIGFQVAYNYWFALCIGNAAIVVALIGYLSVFWPSLATNSWYGLFTGLGCLWFITGINIFGVHEAGRLQLITTILKLFPLITIAIGGLFFADLHKLTVFNVSGKSTIDAFVATTALTFWAFVGFESATVPADHVIAPQHNIPRATILGTLIAAVVYIASTTAVMGLVPMTTLAKSPSPFADAAEVVFGHWSGHWLIAFGAVIACLGALNGWTLLEGQVPMAAANDGLFPHPFAKMSRRNTPAVGLTISSLLVTALLLLRFGASLVDQFTFIVLLAVFASLVPYLYTSFAEVLLILHDPKQFDAKHLSRALVLSVLAFAFIFFAIIGAGKEIVFYGVLVLLSSVPVYIWVRWKDV